MNMNADSLTTAPGQFSPSIRAVGESANISSYVPLMAKNQPYRMAVAFPTGKDRQKRVRYTHLTFADLEEYSNHLACGLREIGIGPGVRTVMMVTPSLEFFALTFALFKAGAVLVMVDPGMGIANLGRCLGEAQPHAFIGVAKAHIARKLFGWAKESIRVLVRVGRLPGVGISIEELARLGRSHGGSEIALVEPHDQAAILFTSGATGTPKGAVYTHGMFLAQVEMIRRQFEIQPGEIDLPTFPLFALFDPALGMTAVIPDMDASRPGSADPRKLVQAIEDYGVTNMFGSPAVLNRVGRYGSQAGMRLPSLRRVLSAGAPVAPAVLERFAAMLDPAARIHTPYGATESLPVSTISSDEILGETRFKTAEGAGICVGRPVAPMHVAVIPITDEPIASWCDKDLLPTHAIGEIAVFGPVVSKSYFNRPEATAAAKVPDAERNGIWHRMGDVGYFDDVGRLWFCGRKVHRVKTRDSVLFSIPCEGVFNRHPAVFRSALVGVPEANAANEAVRIREPALCVELEPTKAKLDRQQLRRELLALAESNDNTRSIRQILFHPAFPVDTRHNAKIDREKLAKWAARKLKRNQP